MKMNKKEAYFAAVRSDLKVFLQQCFGTLNPGKLFLDNWHIDAVLYCLRAEHRGQTAQVDH